MYANIVAPAGQVRVQLPRENFATRRFGSPDKASASIRRHCAALFLCAAAACVSVQRSGSSGAGHFRCGAEFLIHVRRLLCRCAKIAPIVRPFPHSPGGFALHARRSRCASTSWFIASFTAYVSISTSRISAGAERVTFLIKVLLCSAVASARQFLAAVPRATALHTHHGWLTH